MRSPRKEHYMDKFDILEKIKKKNLQTNTYKQCFFFRLFFLNILLGVVVFFTLPYEGRNE